MYQENGLKMGFLFRRVTVSRLYTKEGEQARRSLSEGWSPFHFLHFLNYVFDKGV